LHIYKNVQYLTTACKCVILPVGGTLPSMALPDLVRFVARRSAERPNCASLSQMAERNGWRQDEVLAFVRCEKQPSVKMLRDLAFELGVTTQELERILKR